MKSLSLKDFLKGTVFKNVNIAFLLVLASTLFVFLKGFSIQAMAYDTTTDKEYTKTGYHLEVLSSEKCTHGTDESGYVSYPVGFNPSIQPYNYLNTKIISEGVSFPYSLVASNKVTINSYAGSTYYVIKPNITNLASDSASPKEYFVTPLKYFPIGPSTCPSCGASCSKGSYGAYKFNTFYYSHCPVTDKWYYNCLEQFSYVCGSCNYISKKTPSSKTFTHTIMHYNIVPNTYTINYNGNGGTDVTATTHTYDTASNLSSTKPTRTGYTFKYWNTKADGTGTSYNAGQSVKNLVSSDGGSITLYAIWDVNSYYLDVNGWLNGTVTNSTAGYATFDVKINGTTHHSGVTDYYQKQPYGATFEVTNIMPAAGYVYKGTKPSTEASTYAGLTGNIKAYTQHVNLLFETLTYTINYDVNGGDALPNTMVNEYDVRSDNITLPTPTRTGYDFAGWTGSNGDTPQKTVTIITGSIGNKTYKANWTPKSYYYMLNFNDGKTAPCSQINGISTDTNFKTALKDTEWFKQVPTRDGYVFKEWNTKADGTGTTVTGDTVCTGTTYIHAIWSLETFSVSIPKIVIGDANGNASFTVSSNLNIGTINIECPTEVVWKHDVKADVKAAISNNTAELTPNNKKATFNIECSGLSAGKWTSQFNIVIKYNAK